MTKFHCVPIFCKINGNENIDEMRLYILGFMILVINYTLPVNEKDPIKNNREKGGTPFFKL